MMKITIPLFVLFCISVFHSDARAQLLSDYLFFPSSQARSTKYSPYLNRKLDAGYYQATPTTTRFGATEFSVLLSRPEDFSGVPVQKIGLVRTDMNRLSFIPGNVSDDSAMNFGSSDRPAFACALPMIWLFQTPPNPDLPILDVQWLFNSWIPSSGVPGRVKLGSDDTYCTQTTWTDSSQALFGIVRSVNFASLWQAEFVPPTVETLSNGLRIETIRIKIFREPNLSLGGQGIAGFWREYRFGRGLGFITETPGTLPQDWGTNWGGAIRFGGCSSCAEQTLPSPFDPLVAFPPIAPEGELIEYRNTADFPKSPGGQFFYTKDPQEQATVDKGGAGKFLRTGRAFRIGGYVPVCRFYGSMNPGPNSHFFSADPSECEQTKKLQISPTPINLQQWNSEGTAFYAALPQLDSAGIMRCIIGTQPVYRAYNGAYDASGVKMAWDSNHRYSTLKSDIDEMVTKFGWRDEGLTYCVPTATS